MTENQIVLKIQKLLAHANGTDNEAEAATFMEKAHSLLTEYNLSISTVEGYDQDAVQYGRDSFMDNRCYPWHRKIWFATAKLFFCQYYSRKVKGHKMLHTVIGQEHNCITVQHMAVYLVTTIRRLAKEATDNNVDNYAFEQGCASRISARIWDRYWDSMKPSISSNPGNLPALYNSEESAIDQYLKDLGVVLTTRKGSAPKNTNNPNYRAGLEAGEHVSLDQQVSGSSAHTSTTIEQERRLS